MNPTLEFWWRILLGVCLFAFAVNGRAKGTNETYEVLAVRTNLYKNVRVIQATPEDLLIGYDEGYCRIKLQDLPQELKSQYPYDAQKAAEYETEQKLERVREAQQAAASSAALTAATRATFLKKEAELKVRIASVQKTLKRLNADMRVQSKLAKGHRRRSPRRRQLDALHREKLNVRDELWRLEDELQRTRGQRMRYE